jgi:hypothetical protein
MNLGAGTTVPHPVSLFIQKSAVVSRERATQKKYTCRVSVLRQQLPGRGLCLSGESSVSPSRCRSRGRSPRARWTATTSWRRGRSWDRASPAPYSAQAGGSGSTPSSAAPPPCHSSTTSQAKPSARRFPRPSSSRLLHSLCSS